MRRVQLSVLLMAAVLAVSVPVVAPAWANVGDGAAAPPEQAGPVNPDDGELSAFVAAFLRLISVQHGTMMMMRRESDPHRLEQLRQNALVDMKAAVERDGMSVDRYTQIAVSLRDDPVLRDRIEGILQQMAAAPADEAPAPDGE